MSEPELILDAGAAVAEGPVWDAARGALWWVDIPAGRVHRLDASGGSSVIEVGGIVGAVALRAAGGLVAAAGDGFVAVDDDGGCTRIAAVESAVPYRMNDGACDPAGRFWAGAAPLDPKRHAGAGALWRLEGDGTATKVVDGLSLPNGIDWSPDGATMYVVDSFRFRVDAYPFDVATGHVGEPRAFLTFPEQWEPLCVPDGLCVDEEGAVWVAFWGGSCVRRYAPDGALLESIGLPVSLVTACTFGGVALDEVYVTTALAEGEAGSGGVWRVRPRVKGRVAGEYAG